MKNRYRLACGLMLVEVITGCNSKQAETIRPDIIDAATAAQSARTPDPSGHIPDAYAERRAAALAGPPRRMPEAFEQHLLSSDGMNMQRVDHALSDQRRFEQTIARFRDDYYADPEARETTGLYQRQLGARFGETSDVVLKQIACGLSICAASFTGKQIAEADFVEGLMNSGDANGAQLYSASLRIEPHPGDLASYRVLFTTDRAANVIVEPRQPKVR